MTYKVSSLSAIGDVVQSLLTETQFQSERGLTWVLMDGRSVTGSDYATLTGSSSIPDARGVFLRGKNNGRSDGKQNPDGDSSLGVYQEDAFQGHGHLYRSKNQGANAYNNAGANAGIHNLDNSFPVERPINLSGSGTVRYGTETRPKNITINYFIKINR